MVAKDRGHPHSKAWSSLTRKVLRALTEPRCRDCWDWGPIRSQGSPSLCLSQLQGLSSRPLSALLSTGSYFGPCPESSPSLTCLSSLQIPRTDKLIGPAQVRCPAREANQHSQGRARPLGGKSQQPPLLVGELSEKEVWARQTPSLTWSLPASISVPSPTPQEVTGASGV